MKKYQSVFYRGAEWVYIETRNKKYLLRSMNKNINDVIADPKRVKTLMQNKEEL